MRDEIHKIIEMAKAGSITDAQAAQLIEEIARGDREPNESATQDGRDEEAGGEKDHHHHHHHPFGRAGWTAKMRMFANATSAISGIFPSDLNQNSITMSKVESVNGEGYVFRDNSIAMSAVSGLRLDRAEMSDCSINASRIEGANVIDGKWTDCGVHGSSLEELSIEKSEVSDTGIQATKAARFSILSSKLSDVGINASHLKDVKLGENSSWNDSKLDGCHLSGVEFTRSKMKDTLLRWFRMSEVAFTGCELSDALFSGGEGWKKSGFEQVRFEDSKLDKVLFSECRFRRVTIRNVSLSGIKVTNVDLSDQVIDGNEAFLKAVGLKKPA